MINWLKRTVAGWSLRSMLRDPAAYREFYGLDSRQIAGVTVNARAALGLASYFRGVSVVSSSVAKLPLVVYKRTGDDDREKDTGHAAYPLLRRRVNPGMRASTWLQLQAAHVLTRGNAYSMILRDAGLRPRRLVPLSPWSTFPEQDRETGELVYRTTLPNGAPRTFRAMDIFHVKGLSEDGLTGLDPIATLAPTLGIDLATARYAAEYFAGGCQLSGVLQFPQGMKDPARTQALADWRSISAGLSKVGRTGALWDGVQYSQLGTDPEKNQLLEAREHSLIDVGNAVGVDPSKLGHSQKTSYASLEVAQQAFLSESLDPLLCEIESECFEKLLSPAEQENESHFMEFNRAALLKPDLPSRYAAYTQGRNGGWLSVNDIRRAENMPTIGPAGDIYLQQLNTAPAGDDPEADDTPDTEDDDERDDADPDADAAAA